MLFFTIIKPSTIVPYLNVNFSESSLSKFLIIRSAKSTGKIEIKHYLVNDKFTKTKILATVVPI